jgi:YfiR/HmsC-like
LEVNWRTNILQARQGNPSPRQSHANGRGSRAWLLLWIVVVSCGLWSVSERAWAAPGEKLSEYDVEAAYLFNFGKFVVWPGNQTSSAQPITICVLGEDPFGPTLDRLVTGEKIDGKPVVDKKISRVEEAPSCSILYISTSESAHLNRILGAVKDAPVLTVSDISDFLDRGGMIQFVLRDNRVRFRVNLGPAQRDRLILSSELLKVAVSVKRAEGDQ